MPNAKRPTPLLCPKRLVISRTAKHRRARPLVVGLTGGIASGKSTVAAMFAELGARVVSADELGRKVVEPGEPALAEIVAAFGPAYLQRDGTLDRSLLGRRVFENEQDRALVNRLTHPRITAELQKILRELETSVYQADVVIVEAALLVEAGWLGLVDRVVAVLTQPSTQVARLTARSGITAEEATARLRAQLRTREYVRQADYRIDTDRPLSEVRAEVVALASEFRRLARQADPSPRTSGA